MHRISEAGDTWSTIDLVVLADTKNINLFDDTTVEQNFGRIDINQRFRSIAVDSARTTYRIDWMKRQEHSVLGLIIWVDPQICRDAPKD